jgi:D-inositol-3-phosphate glycosyltransferase
LSTAGGREISIALLTGGQDRHYSYGLARALAAKGVRQDFIGSDELDSPELRAWQSIRFLNLRGSHDRSVSRAAKVRRVLLYYWRLVAYAATADPTIFHILWHNKIEAFDRTILMLYYRLLGKRIVFTAHNVNAGRRDSRNTLLNQLTLRSQYTLSNHIFVHTEKMKQELIEEFSIRASKVSVIPYGINDAVPSTGLTPRQAKQHFGIGEGDKTILFFGQIAPYKGLDYLVTAFEQLLAEDPGYRLIVAGTPKIGAGQYCQDVLKRLEPHVARGRVILDVRHVPDEEAEFHFKAADLLVLPYREIFQSGILFFGYRFGLPVVASDVGSLRDDVAESRTGFMCRPQDPEDLARAIARYFGSELFRDLDHRREGIREHVESRHSWLTVAELTREVYAELLGQEMRPQSIQALEP